MLTSTSRRLLEQIVNYLSMNLLMDNIVSRLILKSYIIHLAHCVISNKTHNIDSVKRLTHSGKRISMNIFPKEKIKLANRHMKKLFSIKNIMDGIMNDGGGNL